MGNIHLELIVACDEYQIINIKLTDNGIIEPKYLNKIQLPQKLDTRKGIIINGKSPVWLYSFLIHECHIFAWVATFDPKIGGIVVQSHSNLKSISDIIPYKVNQLNLLILF